MQAFTDQVPSRDVAAATPKSGHREVAWAKTERLPHGALSESLIKPWAEKRHASREFLACQQLLPLGVAFACGAAAGVTATTHTCTFAGWTALYRDRAKLAPRISCNRSGIILNNELPPRLRTRRAHVIRLIDLEDGHALARAEIACLVVREAPSVPDSYGDRLVLTPL